MKRARVHNDTLLLRRALQEFREGRDVTSSQDYWIRGWTNEVTVEGVRRSCVFAAKHPFYNGWGQLAITEDGTIIWIDRELPPKIIAKNYMPPLWGGGF